MPASLSFEEHLTTVQSSGDRLADYATAAGLDAPVPTCPKWTVAHVVAHQAMVHRWAASHVRGEDGAAPSQTAIREQESDLVGFYREGLTALLAALRAAPVELRAMTFLNDYGTPLEFWARRQAHETTVHMVDTLAAALGRYPSSAEADLAVAVAVDGIDELLRGFLTRGRAKLYEGTPFSLAIRPTDSHRRWCLHVDERLTVSDDDPNAEALSGSASQLYLGLWNRGEEMRGDAGLLDKWRATTRIRWS